MSEYRKTIAAAVGAVITLLSAAGVIDVVSPEVQTSIVTLLTVVAVYLVPNVGRGSLIDDRTPLDFEGSE